MWEIDISVQTLGLLCSFLLGMAAAILYDVLRAVNKVYRPNVVAVFLFDVLYWVILTLSFFVFFIVFTNGQVRMFAIWGAVAGFVFSFLLLSKITLFVFSKIFSVFKFVFNKFKRFLIGFAAVFMKMMRFLKKSLKNVLFGAKKS